MINLILFLIIFLNLISIFILFKMLKGTEWKVKLFTAIILAILNLIISSIIYSIGKVEVPSEIASMVRSLMIFTIFPINLLIFACPIAVQINKLNSKYIEKEKFLKKIILFLIIDIILIILECLYVKNVQEGILNMSIKK